MTKKQEKLAQQIRLFLLVRGHTPQNVDCEQVMREMMEEINYWRMVAKHPGEVDRPRGGQKTAKMDRLRYQHMIGYLTGKHSINQAEAAGTAHQPVIGEEGATIFVKLHQFRADDQKQFVINTNEETWHPGLVDGLKVMPLHQHNGENVALVKWAPHTVFNPHKHWGGEEIFVLEGKFYDEHGEYPKGSWLRSPHMSEHRPYTKEDGALIYVKVGHLAEA